MIYAYDKNALIRDLQEYLSHKILSPSDYIQVFRSDVLGGKSRLVATWLIIEDDITEIKFNNNRNLKSFTDADGILICPSELDLITIGDYFQELGIPLNS